eukprot:SAG31_NODE_4393_length_3273_cov_2.562067_3_plen_201_part_00
MCSSPTLAFVAESAAADLIEIRCAKSDAKPNFTAAWKAGTVYVNGTRLQNDFPMLLSDGDAIRVGAMTMQFHIGALKPVRSSALELTLQPNQDAPGQDMTAAGSSVYTDVPTEPDTTYEQMLERAVIPQRDSAGQAADEDDDDSDPELEVYVTCSRTRHTYTVMLRSAQELARKVQKRLLRLHGAAIGSDTCQLWLEGAR